MGIGDAADLHDIRAGCIRVGDLDHQKLSGDHLGLAETAHLDDIDLFI